MSEQSERIIVPFAGPGAGVGELTWGQQSLWPAMVRENTSLPLGGWNPIAPGRTVADVAGDLSFVMSRHTSMRTLLVFDDDDGGGDGRDGAGGGPPRVRQEVAGAGTAILRVADAGDAGPEEFAAALKGRVEAEVFDYAREWPLRWVVVTSHGRPAFLVWVICHLAADGEGVQAMLDDLAARHAAGTSVSALPAPAALQPLELARQQAGPAAQRQSAATLAYWDRLLREIPPRRFPGSGAARQPRYWQAFYDSPASHLAIQAIAARTGVNTSTVLLAAHAVALARLTQVSPAVAQVVVNNRFRPGFAGMVSPLCDFSLCVIDVAGQTFDEVVARAWRSAMRAYKHAYCDPARKDELIARASRERGAEPGIRCFVNDRRMLARQEPGGEPPGAGRVRAALPRSELTWGYRSDEPNELCYLHINSVPDTVSYELRADTAHVSPAAMEGLLRGMETAVVEAVLDPAARITAAAG